MKIVAKILIKDKNSKVLVLTRGSTHPNFANHLDFPGGEVEPGEDYMTAIIREIKEEIGIDLLPPNIKLLFDKKINDNLTHILYSYQLDETEPKLKISWEHSSYEWIDERKLIKHKIPLNVDPYYKNVIDYLNELPDKYNPSLLIEGKSFNVIKDKRIREGMVLQSDGVFARLGPKEIVEDERIHTLSLYNRGFPVPKILSSGIYDKKYTYFLESSLGDSTFHELFVNDFNKHGKILDETFEKYQKIIEKYLNAQMKKANLSSVTPRQFIESFCPNERILANYEYFKYDTTKLQKAIDKIMSKLESSNMGILQYDLNPYNILPNGIIDFELVGYGPIGFDAMMSTRWSFAWFPNYPARYTMQYRLTNKQIKMNDQLITNIAKRHGLEDPCKHLQEFLVLKGAWALSDFDFPQPDWPADRIAFRGFRAKLLNESVKSYLANKPINYEGFSNISGA
ncbi:MAG TPA: NUDIX domain-containing protein [Candidatus Dormibacteraeota bacterium]|nr:NUDIX domain-containing protein [Candidatus Dormibacteraeota bacterium]